MNGEPRFSGNGFVARLARREETAAIQAFNDANPEYWLLTHGHAAPPDDAEKAFDWRPPADMSYADNLWFLLRDERSDAIVGHLSCVTDLMTRGVCHVAFFLVATHRQGSGFAQEVHTSFERWAMAHGARWLRLRVVEINQRARRFWRSMGYVELVREEGFELGTLRHTLITMVKGLGSERLDDYLRLVPRDRS